MIGRFTANVKKCANCHRQTFYFFLLLCCHNDVGNKLEKVTLVRNDDKKCGINTLENAVIKLPRHAEMPLNFLHRHDLCSIVDFNAHYTKNLIAFTVL